MKLTRKQKGRFLLKQKEQWFENFRERRDGLRDMIGESPAFPWRRRLAQEGTPPINVSKLLETKSYVRRSYLLDERTGTQAVRKNLGKGGKFCGLKPSKQSKRRILIIRRLRNWITKAHWCEVLQPHLNKRWNKLSLTKPEKKNTG